MIKNYFKTAFRNLAKNKIFSLINVSGLSIGISSALVIYLIVSYFTFSGQPYHNSGVTYPMADAIQKDLTGIENVTHFYTGDEVKISIPETDKSDSRIFKKQANLVFADDNYFNLL